MADLMNILSSNYLTVGASTNAPGSKYVNVNPDNFEGTWSGKYANNQSFTVSVSNVVGFRAKAKYQSGSIVKFQDVLIKDNGFRIGDSKFFLKRAGVAQVSTVMQTASGSSLETGFAKQDV
jgi:hypothetical protein